MSEDSYFIFNLIDNLEENMSNCDKMLDIEKVKMFDKIADIVVKKEMSESLDVFSNLNIMNSNIRILAISLINYQSDISSLIGDIFDVTRFAYYSANVDVIEIVRNFISDISEVSNQFSRMEEKIEKKIESLK